jgi:hypothetical protein
MTNRQEHILDFLVLLALTAMLLVLLLWATLPPTASMKPPNCTVTQLGSVPCNNWPPHVCPHSAHNQCGPLPHA